MRQDSLLDPDLAECARVLIARARLLAEREPELYRAATRGKGALAAFFATELGWTLDVLVSSDMVRLHKRRLDVPADRGPRLRREGRDVSLAPRAVLIVAALLCEQLWRRPRMTLNDLLQSVAQVCAADNEQGLLPRFTVVAGDGVSRREAHQSRQNLVDALRLLQADGTIEVDNDLDRVAGDDTSDLVVAASRDRLAAKFSSLSPSLLKLSQMEPHLHADALSTGRLDDGGSLLDESAAAAGDEEFTPASPAVRGDATLRRHRAMRRLVDDPGCDPILDDYLQTSTGRNRGLNVLHALGMTASVRRDWWQVSDPSGLGSALDFPNGRRSERQAALALLDHLGRRGLTPDGQEPPVTGDEILALLERVRVRLPRWAAAYDQRLASLARAAAEELVSAGLLRDLNPGDQELGAGERRWQPTPAVRMWRVKLNAAQARETAGAHDEGARHRPETPQLFEC